MKAYTCRPVRRAHRCHQREPYGVIREGMAHLDEITYTEWSTGSRDSSPAAWEDVHGSFPGTDGNRLSLTPAAYLGPCCCRCRKLEDGTPRFIRCCLAANSNA